MRRAPAQRLRRGIIDEQQFPFSLGERLPLKRLQQPAQVVRTRIMRTDDGGDFHG